MLSFSASDIPSLLLENQGLNGFYFLTLPSNTNRTYRISMETVVGGTLISYYYDFTLDTSVLASHPDLWDDLNPSTIPLDGAVLMGIPFNQNLFKDHTIDPVPPTPIMVSTYKTLQQAGNESIGPNTFSGQTFKLLLIEPYNASVNLVEINKDYFMGQSMIVRFVYYRTIGGQLVFTGSFGDPQMDTDQQLETIRTQICTASVCPVITTINTPGVGGNGGRRYYIFKVTNTPNVIFSEQQPSATVGVNLTEEYSKDGINYRLTLPGHVYTNVPFLLYLNTLDDQGVVTDPPNSIRVNANVNVQIQFVTLIATTKTLKITLITSSLNSEMDLYLYAS